MLPTKLDWLCNAIVALVLVLAFGIYWTKPQYEQASDPIARETGCLNAPLSLSAICALVGLHQQAEKQAEDKIRHDVHAMR
jgi:hypothetical protein